LLVITKLDVTGAKESGDRIVAELCRDALRISAVTGQGVPHLVLRIADMLEQLPSAQTEQVADQVVSVEGII
jgi:GTP-binding protein